MSPIVARPPTLARTSSGGARYYAWGGEQYWSVTTIIGGGVPKYLVAWASKLVAELAYQDVARYPRGRTTAIIRRWSQRGREYVAEQKALGLLKTVDPAKLGDVELALRYLKAEPDRVRDAAAARGSAVHAGAEEYVLERVRETARLYARGDRLPEWPPELRPYLESFIAFLADHRPTFLLTEATVFNRTESYAGTLDAGVILPALERVAPGLGEVPVVVDWKTGNDVYAEVAMQLGSYARGEFVGLADGITEVAPPAFSRDYGLVLHLTPNGRQPYRLRPVEIGERVWRAFLYAREVYRWATEISKEVLGQPLEAAAVEDVA
jgi:hypothetical protein